MCKWQFNIENPNIITIIRTNYDSSVKVRVLCNEGGAAHLWLVKNPRWQIESSLLIGQLFKMATRPVIGQEFKMVDGKAVIWLDNNSRWWMEQDRAE